MSARKKSSPCLKGDRPKGREDMGAPVNPCDPACPRRHSRCHTDCPEYLAYYAYNREQDEKRIASAYADELLIRGVNKSITIRRATKGKLH